MKIESKRTDIKLHSQIFPRLPSPVSHMVTAEAQNDISVMWKLFCIHRNPKTLARIYAKMKLIIHFMPAYLCQLNLDSITEVFAWKRNCIV